MRGLIFGTSYVDTPEKAELISLWCSYHASLNDCDMLIVDSASPMMPTLPVSPRFVLKQFSDNIGHLARGGRDGWGRAFCYGLYYAITAGYDFVAHIECDLLFRLPVMPLFNDMARYRISAMAPLSPALKFRPQDNQAEWIETGLMLFNTEYLRQSGFVELYDWTRSPGQPSPEVVVCRLLGNDLNIAPWKGRRNDTGEITPENMDGFELDWITHCKDQKIYQRFVEALNA